MEFESFQTAIYVNVPSSSLLNCWTKSSLLEEWMFKSATYISANDEPRLPDETCVKGDTYWWEWNDGTTEVGEILEFKDNFLSFTFGSGVIVTVEVEGGDRSLVVLTQSHIMDSDLQKQKMYISCLQGWTFYLANLKSILEGGLDLRETEPDRGSLVNV